MIWSSFRTCMHVSSVSSQEAAAGMSLKMVLWLECSEVRLGRLFLHPIARGQRSLIDDQSHHRIRHLLDQTS